MNISRMNRMNAFIGCLLLFLIPVALTLVGAGESVVVKKNIVFDSVASSPELVKQSKYLKGGSISEVSFHAQHGSDYAKRIERKGVLVKRPGARATILVCHGYMCNKMDSSLFRMSFSNYNVMTFDFRAHGENIEDQTCTFGRDEAYDVIAAIDFIKSDPDLGKLPIIGYCFSMGAVAAIMAQSNNPYLFDAMILDCPYDDSENVIKHALNATKIHMFGYEFGIPGRSFLEKYAFNPYVQSFLKTIFKTVALLDATATNTQIFHISPEKAIKTVSVPCFFIHCYNDEKVPVLAGKRVFEGARGYKRMWITDGRRHFDSFFYNPEKYVYKINHFIEDVLNGTIAHKAQEKIVLDPGLPDRVVVQSETIDLQKRNVI